MLLTIQTRREKLRTRVAVEGELDLASSPALAGPLPGLDGEPTTVLLDLSAVSFMDSRGLHTLVDAVQRARLAGHRIELAPELTAPVRRLFDFADGDRRLSVA